MNYRILFKVLGLLVLLMAGSLVLCGIYAWTVEREATITAHNFALLKSAILAAALGGALLYFGRGAGNEIMRKEAMAIVGLGWLICTAVGAMPYVLCAPSMNPAEAFFESASGFTTTGSSVIADLDVYPRSILLWRATTQWLGGMGILVLFVALLSTLGVGSKSLFRHESSAQLGYGFHSRIRQTALRLWQIYTGLTVVCTLGLVALGMSFYDALLHTFAAISTGGFGTRNDSVAYYHSAPIDAWLCVFMILGGMNFVLLARLVRRDWHRVPLDEELRGYLILLLSGTVFVAGDLILHQGMPILRSLQLSSFQVVSIMTTTGFATADFDTWPTFSKAVLVLLMFVGGCAGSTSGGIKVSRILVLLKTIGQRLTNSFRPNQVVPLRMSGQTLSSTDQIDAVFFVALTGLIVALATLAVTVLEPGLDLTASFTAVCATLFNIGPGLDAVGPTHNFGFLSAPTLTLLSILMILGRLELFALLVLFLPSLWRRY
jgi:trk system potassium uptake protein TrkH